ncbi:hypothetical protein E8E14_001291 [Neopestalotiopsis sp. 37M]|nr:hypothetical protein E8E14_001291 [Neopestalotiopsis sp. 37M]
MSFGFGFGDAAAILEVFGKIARELRSYKDAPAHFQQLGMELDLLRSTLKHVLQISPDTDEDFQTLERIRAVMSHCMQLLQGMINKMLTKEDSLGHFRTTKSLGNVATRLHWSMVAKRDVDEMRKIIISQMLAVNTLLSVQQLSRLRAYSTLIKSSEGALSALVDERCDALMDQTSKILSLVAATPAAVAGYHSMVQIHVNENLKSTRMVDQKLTVATKRLDKLSLQVTTASQVARKHQANIANATRTISSLAEDIKSLFALLFRSSKDMLEAIGRNTVLLLDLATQMKRVIRAIEAIPLHLTMKLVRFDDALGETWALPFQACETWNVSKPVPLDIVD